MARRTVAMELCATSHSIIVVGLLLPTRPGQSYIRPSTHPACTGSGHVLDPISPFGEHCVAQPAVRRCEPLHTADTSGAVAHGRWPAGQGAERRRHVRGPPG